MPTALALLALAQASPLQVARTAERDGRWEDAVEACRRVPEPPPSDPTADAGARLRRRLAVADRFEARRILAAALLRLGRAQEALAAFESGKTLERPAELTACANAPAAHAVVGLLGEGLCLERLGRHAEAVARYFEALDHWMLYEDPRIARRLLALYRAAGQEKALREELVRRDAVFLRRTSRPSADPFALLALSPTRPVRRLLEDDPRPEVRNVLSDVPFPLLPPDFKLP